MLTNDFVGLFQQRSRSMGCVSLFIIYSLNKDISYARHGLQTNIPRWWQERLTVTLDFAC